MRTSKRILCAGLAWLLVTWALAFLFFPPHSSAQPPAGLISLTDNGDVSGSNAVVAAATGGSAVYVDAFNSGTSGTIRCGASNGVSATVGKPIAAGGAYHWEALPFNSQQASSQHYYSLSAVGCYVPSGSTVNFSWVR